MKTAGFSLHAVNVAISIQIYIILAIGGIGLELNDFTARIPFFVVSIFTIMIFHKQIPIGINEFIFIFFAIGYLLAKAMLSDFSDVSLGKIDGLLFSLGVAGLLSRILVFRATDRAYQYLIITGILVLLLTILYKLNFGFFQREIRFFLNGSIVFSWMMAWMMLLACMLKQELALKLLLVSLFFLAIIWTQSRAPIIFSGLFLMLALFIREKGIWSKLRLATIVFGLVAFTIATFDVSVLFHPRVERVVQAIASGDMEALLISFGSRLEQWHHAQSLFLSNPVFGIGLGNFHLNTNSGYESPYPHNFILEILAEHGIVGFLLFLGLFTHLMGRTDSVGRYTGLFFICVLLVSGDLAYLRMPFLVLYFGVLVRNAKIYA